MDSKMFLGVYPGPPLKGEDRGREGRGGEVREGEGTGEGREGG
jgi:hypothetical protein